MKKLALLLCLFLVGCGSVDKENETETLKSEIEQLKGEIEQLKTEANVDTSKKVESMSREEASGVVEEYLNNYQFDDIIGEVIVSNSEGNDGKMDFVSIRLVASDPSLDGEMGYGYDANTMQTIYTDMMYYCNGLLNELIGLIPNYTQNISVTFSGQYIESMKTYPQTIAYVGRIENEKVATPYFDYAFNGQFGYYPELVEVEDLN